MPRRTMLPTLLLLRSFPVDLSGWTIKVADGDTTVEGKKAKVELAGKAKAGGNGVSLNSALTPATARPAPARLSAQTSDTPHRPAIPIQPISTKTVASPSPAGPSRPSNALLKQPSGAPSVSREAKDLRTSKHPYADRQKACECCMTLVLLRSLAETFSTDFMDTIHQAGKLLSTQWPTAQLADHTVLWHLQPRS